MATGVGTTRGDSKTRYYTVYQKERYLFLLNHLARCSILNQPWNHAGSKHSSVHVQRLSGQES